MPEYCLQVAHTIWISELDQIAFVEISYNGRGLLLQLLRLIMGRERLDQRLELAIHHLFELMNGEPDAMIGQPVLREIISTNLFATVSGADHS